MLRDWSSACCRCRAKLTRVGTSLGIRSRRRFFLGRSEATPPAGCRQPLRTPPWERQVPSVGLLWWRPVRDRAQRVRAGASARGFNIACRARPLDAIAGSGHHNCAQASLSLRQVRVNRFGRATNEGRTIYPQIAASHLTTVSLPLDFERAQGGPRSSVRAISDNSQTRMIRRCVLFVLGDRQGSTLSSVPRLPTD